jgi:hypothetical protein
MIIEKKPYEPPTILHKKLTPMARAQILAEYEKACAAMADMLSAALTDKRQIA